MIGILAKQIQGSPNDLMTGEGCSGPNTVKDRFGQCVCQRGSIGDDPIQLRGCWNCSSECHYDAVCMYPGVCQCPNGLVGDGVSSCAIPVPHIRDVVIESAKEATEAVVWFSIPTDYNPEEVFCRFGNYIVVGTLLDSTHMKCSIVKSLFGKVRLSISFDSLSWSDGPLNTFGFVTNKPLFTISSVLLISLTVLSLLFFIVQFSKFASGSRSKKSDDQVKREISLLNLFIPSRSKRTVML